MFLFCFSLEDFNNTVTDWCDDELDIRHEYSLTTMRLSLHVVWFFVVLYIYRRKSSFLDYSRPEFVKPPWVFGSFNKLDEIFF